MARSLKNNPSFHPDQQVQPCYACGEPVDVRTDEWNENLQRVGHRMCDNSQCEAFEAPLDVPDMQMIDMAMRNKQLGAKDPQKYVKVLLETIEISEGRTRDFHLLERVARAPYIYRRRASYAGELIRRIHRYPLTLTDSGFRERPIKSKRSVGKRPRRDGRPREGEGR